MVELHASSCSAHSGFGPRSMRVSDDLVQGDTDHSSRDMATFKGCTALVMQLGSDISAATDGAVADNGHILCQSCENDAEPQMTACMTETPRSKCLSDAVQVPLRLRYSRSQILHLQSSFTSEPVGWTVMRDNREKLTCCKDCKLPAATPSPDWPVIMEGWKRNKPVALPEKKPSHPGSPCTSPRHNTYKGPIAPHRPVSPRQKLSTAFSGYSPFGDHPLSNLSICTTGIPADASLMASAPPSAPPSSSWVDAKEAGCGVIKIRANASWPAEFEAVTRKATATILTNPSTPTDGWSSCSTSVGFSGSNTGTPSAAAAAVPFWTNSDSLIAVKELIAQLCNEDPEAVAQAAGQLANMCATSVEDQSIVRHEQGIPILTKLLQSRDAAVQESAAAAVWSLSRGNSDNQAVLVCSGAMPRLVRLLGSNSSGLQYVAASAVLALVKDQKRLQDPAADAGAIQMLAHVLKTGSTLGKCVAAETLQAIIIDSPRNQTELLKTSALDLLVNLMQNDESHCPDTALKLQAAAVGVLLALMSLHKHHDVVAAAGARPVLQKLLKSNQDSEHARDLHRQVMAALKKLDGIKQPSSPYQHIPTPYMKLRPFV